MPAGHRRPSRNPGVRRTRLLAAALAALVAGVVGAGAADAAGSADFAIDPETAGRGVPVTMTAASECAEPVVCTWSGEAGLTGTGRTLEWRYPDPGSYDVTLTVADGVAPPESLTRTVTVVNTAPDADFTAAVTDREVIFESTVSDPDGDALDYAWSFGDGAASSAASPTHRYSAAGTYPVKLTVTDPHGATAVAAREVVVGNRAPVAGLTARPDVLAVGQEATLDSSSSSDPDGDSLVRSWKVDGQPLEGGPILVKRSFDQPGRHTVEVTVTDPSGAQATATALLEVSNEKPSATVVASNVEPTTDEPVVFAVESEDPDGGALRYGWELDGDDDYDDDDRESVDDHRFDSPGPKKVGVKVTDDEGEEVYSDIVVNVRNRPPVVDFDWSPVEVGRKAPVTFVARAADPDGFELAELAWDLDGDGEYDDAFGETALHAFRRGGGHEVGLRATDRHGAVSELRQALVVGNRPPRASFTVSPERIAPGTTIELVSDSADDDGEIVALDWDLDADGQFDDATGPRVQRRVDGEGKLSVALRATDDDGGTDVAVRTLDTAAAQAPRPRRSDRLLSPFPTVRMAGQVTRRGAAFRLVQVTAPRRATIAWSCRGRGCPARGRSVRGGRVRLTRLHRSYRAGATIEIRVTRKGWIGKYTRIRVRAGRAPARTDACLYPGSRRPRACPRR